jgi:hypothetical protein
MTTLLSSLVRSCQCWWLGYQWRAISLNLASAREHLEVAETDLCRQLPPEIHADIQSEVVDWRARVQALEGDRCAIELARLQLCTP